MRIVLLVAFLLPLAGCLGSGGGPDAEAKDPCGPRPDREWRNEDWSKETWSVNVTAQGSFVVEVPVPLSPGGTEFSDWTAHLLAPAGWVAGGVETPRGPAVRIEGQGAGVVTSCSIQPASERGNGCCAEQYLDAAWSTTPETRPDSVAVHVGSGTLDLEIRYTAESNWCGAEASYGGVSLVTGWNEVEGEHPAWCE